MTIETDRSIQPKYQGAPNYFESSVIDPQLSAEIFSLADSRTDLQPDQSLDVPREHFSDDERGDLYHNWIQKGLRCEVLNENQDGEKEHCGKRGGVVVEFDIAAARFSDSIIVCSTSCYESFTNEINREYLEDDRIPNRFTINGFGREKIQPDYYK